MNITYTTVQRPATVSVAEAARLLGVGRSLAYEVARWRGELAPGVPIIRVGERRYRVPIRPLAAALGLEEAEVIERLREAGNEREVSER